VAIASGGKGGRKAVPDYGEKNPLRSSKERKKKKRLLGDQEAKSRPIVMKKRNPSLKKALCGLKKKKGTARRAREEWAKTVPAPGPGKEKKKKKGGTVP